MDKSAQNKLVVDFEYDDELKQQNLMMHLTNLLNDFGEEPLSVEVVAYGPAIKMVAKHESLYADAIKKLQARGIIFHGCHNAMMKFGITEDQLLDTVMPVPSGVGYIVKKQLDGYVYLKG